MSMHENRKRLIAALRRRGCSVAGDFYSVASQHPGGAHVLLADSSSRFLHENTDLDTLKRLQTIAGSETVQLPWQDPIPTDPFPTGE